MNLGDYAGGLKFLIRDRDTEFTAAFDTVLAAAGVRIIKTPVQAPRANANRGTVDRQRPPRVPGPDADHQRPLRPSPSCQ
jgi:hypothetical protein